MKHENLFKIYIPEPCNEDWDKMTPNQQGAFCKVCSKTVVDFSKKTENEVQQFILENMDKRLCGRFRVSQLETMPIPVENKRLKIEIEQPKFSFPGFLIPVLTPFRATALALMLCASAMLSACSNSGNSGGDDTPLTGIVALVDSTNKPVDIKKDSAKIPDEIINGGLSIRDTRKTDCKTDSSKSIELRTVGKLRVVKDSVRVDTTENTIKGEIEPRIKMGMIRKTN
ncbi:MAG: hypothetical protein K8I03_12180 [Ignavibacteria bacterium]|nr:hypothetical protein [Ignavibacteria bacterium]